MVEQVAFGRRGAPVATRSAPARKTQAPTPPAAADDNRPKPPVAYADLDGGQRIIAAIPFLTVALILGLGVIFWLQLLFAFDVGAGSALSLDALVAQGADSYDLTVGGGELWRIVLAPLLHASSGHLFGNCLALFLIGAMLEPMIGRGWFAAIFALAGVGGEVASLIANVPWMPGVGASGAITGVLAASFVMSFSADTFEESWRMLRRALVFGVPALAPLLWGAHGHTNYYAHLGGALVGGVIAFVLDQTWDRTEFRPLFHRQAGVLALILFGLGMPAAAMAATQYSARRADSAHFIPLADLEANFDKLANRAPEFERRYPDDPMTKILTGVYDAENGHVAEGEAALRAAITMEVPRRPRVEPPLHATAQGFLAVLLKAEGRPRDAHRLSDPLCKSRDNPNITQMLVKSKLCERG